MEFYNKLTARYFISIKTKLVIFFLLIVIIPIMIMAINSYYSSQKLILKKYTDFLLEISKQSNVRIEEFFTDIEKLSMITSYGLNSYTSAEDNAPVQNFLKDSSEFNEKQAYQSLINAIMIKDRVYSVYVYNLKGGKNLYVSSNKPINYNYTPVNEAWFKEILNSNEIVTIIDTHRDDQIRGEDNWVISSARKIYDLKDGSLLGLLIFSVNIDFVDKVCGNILANKRSAFSIVDENDQIIYNSNYKNLGRKLTDIFPINTGNFKNASGGFITRKGNEDYIVTYNSFNKLKWKTVLYISMDEASIEGAILKQNLAFIVITLLIFSIACSYLISAQITKPIKKLIKNMAKVEKGQFENLALIKSNDEVGLLSKRFNQMSLELKELIQRIHIEQKQKTDAEMSALQAQINPHFLYNTLSSVKWIAAIQKSDKIVQMVEALIYMLRYTTSKVGDTVTVGDEIENVRNYITIQKVRYYNRLHVEYDIDEGLSDYKILKFTIQPIVENAIFHGLSAKEEEGVIKVQVRRQEKDIAIIVEDNGIGMDQATIAGINRKISDFKSKFNNIGISNVNSRIKMHFGEQYGIQFESELGKGTRFFILIPAVLDV